MGPKISYLDIFRFLEFQIVIFEISTLEFVKNDFSTHTENFGIGFAFYKGSASIFSKGLDLVPGLPHKVLQLFSHEKKTFFLTLLNLKYLNHYARYKYF